MSRDRTFYKHNINAIWLLKDQSFDVNILSKFRDTPAGNLCRTNDTIKQVGYRHYCLRKAEVSKQNETRKGVMSEMRELARLFQIL